MAADVLGVGESRVRIDPKATDRLEDAITRGSIRSLAKEGIIWVIQKQGVSRGRTRMKHAKAKLRGRAGGSKEGAKFARVSRKEAWVARVTSLRRRLKVKKDRGEINNPVFWQIYRQIGVGQIKTIKRMEELVRAASGR